MDLIKSLNFRSSVIPKEGFGLEGLHSSPLSGLDGCMEARQEGSKRKNEGSNPAQVNENLRFPSSGIKPQRRIGQRLFDAYLTG
jgi:hypothetical protein